MLFGGQVHSVYTSVYLRLVYTCSKGPVELVLNVPFMHNYRVKTVCTVIYKYNCTVLLCSYRQGHISVRDVPTLVGAWWLVLNHL